MEVEVIDERKSIAQINVTGIVQIVILGTSITEVVGSIDTCAPLQWYVERAIRRSRQKNRFEFIPGRIWSANRFPFRIANHTSPDEAPTCISLQPTKGLLEIMAAIQGRERLRQPRPRRYT